MNHETISPYQPLTLNPVGVVASGLKTPMLRADKDGLTLEQRMEKAREQHRRTREMICKLVLKPEYEPLLEGIEGFSHVLVLYWPHLVPQERRSLQKVHPMGRKDVPEQGVFATCSPARPNPVLVSAVPLVERRGNRLLVRGLEAVDGSPILDIKPYNPGYYRVDDPVVPDWMARLQREMEAED